MPYHAEEGIYDPSMGCEGNEGGRVGGEEVVEELLDAEGLLGGGLLIGRRPELVLRGGVGSGRRGRRGLASGAAGTTRRGVSSPVGTVDDVGADCVGG